MKFLLVTSLNKNLVKLWACQETSHIGSLLPPVDLCSIAAVLKREGQEVKILDPRLYKDPLVAYTNELKLYKPDILMLNITTTSAYDDYKIIRYTPTEIKKVAFGTHAMAVPHDCFKNGIEYITLGDPELGIIELIRHNFKINSIKGLIDKNSSPQYYEPNYIENLDELPFPALDLIDIRKYHTLYVKSKRFSILLGSRGCSYSCTYCLMPQLFGTKIRFRSIENVVDQMQYDYEKYKITEFQFLDATFNISEKRVIRLCEEVMKRHLGFLKWSCNMRVFPLSEKLLSMMKMAGCKQIYYGVEDVDLLAKIKKEVTLDEIKKAFYSTKKVGIKTVAFVMIFPDGDKSERLYISRIVSLLKEIKADSVQCNAVIPFPGTSMYEDLKQNLSMDWSCYDPNGNRLPYDSPIDLISVKKGVYLKFALLNPILVIKTLFEVNLRGLLFVIVKFCVILKEEAQKFF